MTYPHGGYRSTGRPLTEMPMAPVGPAPGSKATDGEHRTPPCLTVRVPGVPAPQGSIKHLGKGRPAQHSNKATLLPWRASVISHLQVAVRADRVQPGWPLFGPVAVDLLFVFQRPKTYPNRPLPHVYPDVDKLARAILDCLGTKKGAGVVGDDAQVVDLVARKRYGPLPCVEITVTSLDMETP